MLMTKRRLEKWARNSGLSDADYHIAYRVAKERESEDTGLYVTVDLIVVSSCIVVTAVILKKNALPYLAIEAVAFFTIAFLYEHFTLSRVFLSGLRLNYLHYLEAKKLKKVHAG